MIIILEKLGDCFYLPMDIYGTIKITVGLIINSILVVE